MYHILQNQKELISISRRGNISKAQSLTQVIYIIYPRLHVECIKLRYLGGLRSGTYISESSVVGTGIQQRKKYGSNFFKVRLDSVLGWSRVVYDHF